MSLCVQMSAVITRHSGGAFAAMRFLTAISKLQAVSLTTSGSVNGSTSRPDSVVSMVPIIGSILSVIIFFLYSFDFRGYPRTIVRMVRDRLGMGLDSFCFSPFGSLFSFSLRKVGGRFLE